ncbi:kelch repeat-containing protein [Draconibacterium mangrovi]|uniref:kelch repeat-containing protein n=1 Tax=Draconibacterium mangrovi TaxID=2697469 RepID=UPI0013D29FEE|nr:kelch repeat-containing protein [Draconibacterium mangrovi]
MKLLLCVNVIFLLLATKIFAQNELNSGLYFASSEVVQDKRTSLNLTPEEALNLTGGFKLDFDIQLRLGDGYYGYVFRIFSNETENFDFIANYASENENFSLIFKEKILCTFRWEDVPDLDYNKWFHVTFQLDSEQKYVEISLNGVSKKAAIYFDEDDRFDIVFGISKTSPFQSTDVCPMTLKNIQIYNHNDKMVRHWLLSKHTFNKTYDEVEEAVAVVENPKWLIDAHLSWEEVRQLSLSNFYGVVSNETTDELFFVDKNSILRYDLNTGKLDSILYKGGSPYRQMNEKHVVFNAYTNEIWSYNLDQQGISKFSFSSQRWSNDPVQMDESNFGHHNKVISPVDSSLLAILGYGLYRYNSTVFNYDPRNNSWKKFDRCDQIEPRYLAAAGLLNADTLLVFGGYGSKTGRQELTPGAYNDLYSLDLNTLHFSKMLDYTAPEFPFVPAESLIIDDDSTGFYTLIFDNSKYSSIIKLAKFGIYEPSQFIYPDSIVFDFQDTDSWSYLYLNKKLRKLFAVTTNKSDVKIYSMAYPPLVPDDVFQKVKAKNNPVGKNKRIILFGLALIVMIVFLAYVNSKRKRKNVVIEEKSSEPVSYEQQMFRRVEKIKKSSVLFLGGFQIYSDSGVDITSDFSPMLKQLFLMIFFNTVHRGKGISSKKLDETLWFDKTEKSARNNRNVNISKLRNAIEEVAGLEIVYENSYWKLKMSSNIYCDYLHVLNITNRSEDEHLDLKDIATLYGLLDKGELLPNLEIDWIDSYKAQFTNSVVDFLVKLLSRQEIKGDKKTLLHIADCIFSLDSLNEDALIVKCQILHKDGKGSVALHSYNSFCKEYQNLLNSEFPASFKDVLAGNTDS